MSNKYVLIEKKNLILPLHILWIFRNDKAGTIMSSFNCPYLGQCYNKAGVVALMTALCVQSTMALFLWWAKPPIYLHWDFRNFWHSPVWNIQFDFFPSLIWEKNPVWNIKLAKSKIPIRVVKNVISKWTKMEFPRFPFLWFSAVRTNKPKAGIVYLCKL